MATSRTIGNHSYISLKLDGRADEHIDEILKTLDEFEKSHPDQEVTDWHLLNAQDAPLVDAYVFGIFIDHKPRTPGK